ncbi:MULTISPECIES: hypothetical protein [unclassified Guyparkeria]|uniref:hypothetical protein n=1 Tax=unclassified Guyparkeria TaxID=2626246 RepID=UPI0012E3B9D1|nr:MULTISPECIES: hypothetical protein [unclassified Guyparkeria]
MTENYGFLKSSLCAKGIGFTRIETIGSKAKQKVSQNDYIPVHFVSLARFVTRKTNPPGLFCRAMVRIYLPVLHFGDLRKCQKPGRPRKPPL